MNITKVSNGYIVEHGGTYVYTTLREVMLDALLHFEGLSPTFTGKYFGDVTISRQLTFYPQAEEGRTTEEK